MKLYFVRNSCAMACHIALEEVGESYEAIKLDMNAGQLDEPHYTALNPKKRVPTLVSHDGVLTETPAILVYIAQKYPAARLAPMGNIFAFAQMQAFNSYLCSTVHVAHAHGLRGRRWADEESSIADMRRKVTQVMHDCFDLIETSMIQGEFVLGHEYSICDPYLFVMTRYAIKDGVNIKSFSRINRHLDIMSERPAVKRVIAAHSSKQD